MSLADGPETNTGAATGSPVAKKAFPTWLIAVIVGGVLLLGLVIIVIVGVFFALGPRMFSGIEKAKVGAASGDIGAFNSALALYQVDVTSQTYPASLYQLCNDNVPGWAGPYMATISPDPWNNSYQYLSDGTDYEIQSVHKSDTGRSETIRYKLSTGMMESLP